MFSAENEMLSGCPARRCDMFHCAVSPYIHSVLSYAASIEGKSLPSGLVVPHSSFSSAVSAQCTPS